DDMNILVCDLTGKRIKDLTSDEYDEAYNDVLDDLADFNDGFKEFWSDNK
ncbi:unnamed protein product, partial [marine sediment metagenome]